MLLMTGVLLNVFENPKGISKEGKEFGGQNKIQVLGEVLLQNGETKHELVDLTCHDVGYFSPLLNQSISFPVGVMSAGKNQTIFFIPKNSKPISLSN
ncbi:hypothetical protein CKA49_33110 [Pseudomonas aeruginosa]|uniref:hypothetical protein n=1 Tax=Pseudomonas aeruginosa TaxID=287 RepID=UPI000EF7187E|nr:hypothetical protein [Pseudomonas aeruginosa]RLR70424.1 hypothetical protein CKA49_33110 [Pseudomonas aeruginosa]